MVNEVVGNLVEFNVKADHLAVHLSLPSPPIHSNGRWDGVLKQVVWEAEIVARTNKTRLPVSCYANWAQADEAFQRAHFGKPSLTGDDLTEYCLWRSSLDTQHGAEWDSFLSGLQPGGELMDRINSFRFSGESEQAGTNGQQQVPSTSYPRELLTTALSGSKMAEEALQHLMKQRVTKQN